MEEVESPEEILAKQQRKEKKDLQGSTLSLCKYSSRRNYLVAGCFHFLQEPRGIGNESPFDNVCVSDVD